MSDVDIRPKEEILESIEKRVSSYSEWSIGTTGDVHTHEYSKHRSWRCWHCETPAIAQEIVAHFVSKGMGRSPDNIGEKDARHVYIY